MKNIAIIGASYLQLPLIKTAKEMGCVTHVFAWAVGDEGERVADYFYPISIIEKEQILSECIKIGIDGICTIASDLAVITVNYVAEKMGLVGNSMECTQISTNKHQMRRAFDKGGDPSPKSVQVEKIYDLEIGLLQYPVIVKPIDRSGSRGITKLQDQKHLFEAIEYAKNQSFEKKALVEEFVEGQEYSVECISWKGRHTFLALTKKYTTNEPHFIERGHLEPAQVEDAMLERIKTVVFHALDTLKIEYGASHTELKISSKGKISIIEIGGRMGGDFIGSDLVKLSTGVDFIQSVIEVALGKKPRINISKHEAAAVRFIFTQEDIDVLSKLKKEHPEILVREEVQQITEREVKDSSTRFGYFLMKSSNVDDLRHYLP